MIHSRKIPTLAEHEALGPQRPSFAGRISSRKCGCVWQCLKWGTPPKIAFLARKMIMHHWIYGYPIFRAYFLLVSCWHAVDSDSFGDQTKTMVDTVDTCWHMFKLKGLATAWFIELSAIVNLVGTTTPLRQASFWTSSPPEQQLDRHIATPKKKHLTSIAASYFSTRLGVPTENQW
jgi:hypothetical protein